MTDPGTDPTKPVRKHLHAPEAVLKARETRTPSGINRDHVHGNGVRIHGLYFAATCLAAVGLLITAAILITGRM